MRTKRQLAVAAALATLVAAAALGGLGYASSSGADQYQPGLGWGDPSRVHSGPPGLTLEGPVVLEPFAGGAAVLVVTRFAIDEQAHLYLHVFGPDGRELLVTQNGSRVGNKVAGKPDKTVQSLVLVPRVLQLVLRIPANLLVPRKGYMINIVALSPLGERAALNIPFRA